MRRVLNKELSNYSRQNLNKGSKTFSVMVFLTRLSSQLPFVFSYHYIWSRRLIIILSSQASVSSRQFLFQELSDQSCRQYISEPFRRLVFVLIICPFYQYRYCDKNFQRNKSHFSFAWMTNEFSISTIFIHY